MTDTSQPSSPGKGDEIDRETFDYLMKKDIPTLMDSICRHLMRTKPRKPHQAIVSFLNAKHGNHHGGIAVAGRNNGGGWLRILDNSGNMLGSVDRLNFRAEGSIQYLAAAPRDRVVYVATITQPEDQDDGAGGGGGSNAMSSVHHIPPGDDSDDLPVTTITKYSLDGHLLGTFTVSKEIAALNTDRDKGHIWVLFKGGGGVVLQSNGNKLRDLSLPPSHAIVFGEDGYFWLLAGKTMEKREVDSCALELAIHLPDSMLAATSFGLSGRHVWCAAANSDGSSNYVGGFDFSGRGIPNFVPPPGSILAHDRMRGGMWHLPRQCAKGQLSFTNERGSRVMSIEIGKSSKNSIVVDYGSGLLWHFRETDGGECRLGLYDPLKMTYAADMEAPHSRDNTTHMIGL